MNDIDEEDTLDDVCFHGVPFDEDCDICDAEYETSGEDDDEEDDGPEEGDPDFDDDDGDDDDEEEVLPSERPLAIAGLHSYRYRGRYGWVMIGAQGDAEALREATCSVRGPVTRSNLQRWKGKGGYVSVEDESTP